MKKLFFRLCAALLSFIFCIGCNGSPAYEPLSTPSSVIASSLASSQISSPVSSVSISSSSVTSVSNAEPPIEDNLGYFIFVDSLLIGICKNNYWYNADGRTIYIDDLLGYDAYYGYSQSQLLGVSEKLTLGYGNSNDCFWEGGKPLIPYAHEHDAENKRLIFHIPFQLPLNLNYIRSNRPNDNVVFDIPFTSDNNERIPLVLSADFNPLPKSEVKQLAGPFSAQDGAAVYGELSRLDIPGAPINITDVYEYDIEGDGKTERFIFAQTPLNSEGYAHVGVQEIAYDNSGFYYMVLCKDETGYETVLSWGYPYRFANQNQDVLPGDYLLKAFQSLAMVGIFDLNHDGIFELCLKESGIEEGSVFVYALDKYNEWNPVLEGYHPWW